MVIPNVLKGKVTESVSSYVLFDASQCSMILGFTGCLYVELDVSKGDSL